MTYKANVTISRRSDDFVYIAIQDNNSRSEFVEVKLSLEDYGKLITGLSSVEGEAEYRKLDCVGKIKVVEARSVVCPINTFDKAVLGRWLVENCQEDGWKLNTHLGSQKSVDSSGGKTKLNYSVYKYTEPEAS